MCWYPDAVHVETVAAGYSYQSKIQNPTNSRYLVCALCQEEITYPNRSSPMPSVSSKGTFTNGTVLADFFLGDRWFCKPYTRNPAHQHLLLVIR